MYKLTPKPHVVNFRQPFHKFKRHPGDFNESLRLTYKNASLQNVRQCNAFFFLFESPGMPAAVVAARNILSRARIRGDHINRPDIWSTKFPERRGSILIKNGAHLDAIVATPGLRDILYYYGDVAVLLLKFVLLKKKKCVYNCTFRCRHFWRYRKVIVNQKWQYTLRIKDKSKWLVKKRAMLKYFHKL